MAREKKGPNLKLWSNQPSVVVGIRFFKVKGELGGWRAKGKKQLIETR